MRTFTVKKHLILDVEEGTGVVFHAILGMECVSGAGILDACSG